MELHLLVLQAKLERRCLPHLHQQLKLVLFQLEDGLKQQQQLPFQVAQEQQEMPEHLHRHELQQEQVV
jgi:hypothetical protein